MKSRPLLALILPLFLACCGEPRSPYGVVDASLALDRVVLYRNGIGYFERRGEVDGDVLRIRVRKDQVDDLLKSLTVVDADGQAVSVSMPLDAQSWASPALAVLGPGRGSLAAVLDSMRGTEVTLHSREGEVRGRVMMVERVINEPDPNRGTPRGATAEGDTQDNKITVVAGDRMRTVRLSRVTDVTLHNGDLAVQLGRNLDASAGEGMFQQVDVELRLTEARSHDLMVSYVAAAPIWKPTYRVVLPKGGEGAALLQGWAVVDNLSGEDWDQISLSLTSGAPIAFRYDLHTPRNIHRSDLSGAGTRKQARVSLGETSFQERLEVEEEDEDNAGEELLAKKADKSSRRERKPRPSKSAGFGGGGGDGMPSPEPASARIESAKLASKAGILGSLRGDDDESLQELWGGKDASDGPSLDLDSLRRSTAASARTKQVTGLTQTDLSERVTVPDGTSTMVALLNAEVEASETFLFKPGGAGTGYESNPYRVVRFKNTSEYVLESGPISIYSGGSFVGEGLSEVVGAGASATIPFAVEPGIAVTSTLGGGGQELKLVKIVRGVLEAESYTQRKTTYELRLQPGTGAKEVLIRHPRAGNDYTLRPRPAGTEDLDGAYLVPVPIASGKAMAEIEVIEETPSTIQVTMWDSRSEALLQDLMSSAKLNAEDRARLQPIVDSRAAIGLIDTKIEGLRRQQAELDRRANETRQNLLAIKQDGRASALRKKLSKRLDEFTREADALGRSIVTLNSERLEAKIALEDRLSDFDFRAPTTER